MFQYLPLDRHTESNTMKRLKEKKDVLLQKNHKLNMLDNVWDIPDELIPDEFGK